MWGEDEDEGDDEDEGVGLLRFSPRFGVIRLSIAGDSGSSSIADEADSSRNNTLKSAYDRIPISAPYLDVNMSIMAALVARPRVRQVAIDRNALADMVSLKPTVVTAILQSALSPECGDDENDEDVEEDDEDDNDCCCNSSTLLISTTVFPRILELLDRTTASFELAGLNEERLSEADIDDSEREVDDLRLVEHARSFSSSTS